MSTVADFVTVYVISKFFPIERCKKNDRIDMNMGIFLSKLNLLEFILMFYNVQYALYDNNSYVLM